jgi:hypothetical protein
MTTNCCRQSLGCLWAVNSFKHVASLICFHSIPCASYQSKVLPDMVLKAADSQFLFSRLCTLPILLVLKLMVATLRSFEIIGLGGEAIQFITSCQQYHCCFMTRQESYLLLSLQFHGHSLKVLQF